MRVGVVVFPGSNCDRDAIAAAALAGTDAFPVWHEATDLEGADLVIVPGGFAYGDYLRCGAMARHSPVMAAVRRFAEAGGPVLGICNGFQVLCESGLLPGALVRNRGLHFVCEFLHVRVERAEAPFLSRARAGQVLRLPVKHGEGCYVAAPEELARLEADGRVVLRYCDAAGETRAAANPNGAVANIAGICNARGNVMGLMPHPEHAVEAAIGGSDGRTILGSLVDAAVGGTR